MKRLQILSAVVFATVAFTACSNADYETTSSGLKYKIFDGGSKEDSTKEGNVLKMNVTVTISGSKDSLLLDTYGKMPYFQPVQPAPPAGQPYYDPSEVFGKLRKGDSLVAIVYIDSLISKGLMPEAQLPPYFKKGDKLIHTYKVLEVFKDDSIARVDYQKEGEKEQLRQKTEMEVKQKAELDSLKKSGGIDQQNKEVTDYLSKKGITGFIKTPLGTYVKIDNAGTGAPVADGKFVTVKYNGKHLASDSSFQNSSFTTQIAGPMGGSIKGFEDGLKQFKEGGKGTIYIPGYLSYGGHPPAGAPFKPFEPLYFEVEIQKVSDTDPNAPAQAGHSADDGHGH